MVFEPLCEKTCVFSFFNPGKIQNGGEIYSGGWGGGSLSLVISDKV